MNASPIAVVGDAIIDIIRRGDDPETHHPGGAALNVAKGLAILGERVLQVFVCGDDEAGRGLVAHLRAHGVTPVSIADPRGTGVANAHFPTATGEPIYTFSDAVVHRQYSLTPEVVEALRSARAVVVTAFPMDDPDSVGAYLEAIDGTHGFRVIDANPRVALLSDPEAFRDGFERLARTSDLIKVSDEDIKLLYGEANPIPRLTAGGAALVRTHGADGATMHFRDGERIHVPITVLPAPIIDTLGAGDATLAALVGRIVHTFPRTDAVEWEQALRRAMDVAASTCRAPGGTLRLPASRTGL